MEAWNSGGPDCWQGRSGSRIEPEARKWIYCRAPLQLVCNLEIGGENPDYKINPEAGVFVPTVRPSRRTKEIANKLFKDIAAQEVEDGD